MKQTLLTGLLLGVALLNLQAQRLDKIINEKEVARIEKELSSDAMQGRAVYSTGIEKAASFIAAEFQKAGLTPIKDSSSFRQAFYVISPEMVKTSGTLNGEAADQSKIVVFTSQPEINITETSGYEKAYIKKGDNIFQTAFGFTQSGKNTIVLVDTSFAKFFSRLSVFKRNIFPGSTNVVFVLTSTDLTSYQISATHRIVNKSLANVVGILPGKSRPDEYVIFSGHYDHLGIGKPEKGDSIYNGANDDAAGTTAVIMLAKYFSALRSNERTLVFAAFTAEETGGFGSQYFSKQFDPAKVMAMFNIEMIGTESKWGTNSAYITGYEKTDMGKILEKNLQGTAFTFHPDPYPDQQLFYRSDNATLARQGVPAHTISTSKMDSEPNYHKASDQIETLDMKNMAMIIKAIATSSVSIIKGADTPSRVNTAELR